jgi:hypothetical protein
MRFAHHLELRRCMPLKWATTHEASHQRRMPRSDTAMQRERACTKLPRTNRVAEISSQFDGGPIRSSGIRFSPVMIVLTFLRLIITQTKIRLLEAFKINN